MSEVKIAIVGLGNCASSLVQGSFYYAGAEEGQFVPGLMRPRIGDYGPESLKFVAAFDVDPAKVGKTIDEALDQGQNCTEKFVEVPPIEGLVHAAPVMDGLGRHYSEKVPEPVGYDAAEDNGRRVLEILRATGAEVIVNYLPVGSAAASRFWAEQALKAGCGFVNCIPEFIATDEAWQARFREAGLPLMGDDIKSQVGATIIHRQLVRLFAQRGVKVARTYQLNFGGNMDFWNMLDQDRLSSKKVSKRGSVLAELPYEVAERDLHVSPSDYVEWLGDRKWAFIRIEGEAFGGTPLNVELKLEVWDSPNSAGVVIDAVRCAKIALDRKIGGPIVEPCAIMFKTPPKNFADADAHERLNAWIG